MVLPNKSLFKESSIYGKHVLNIIVMRGKAVHEHLLFLHYGFSCCFFWCFLALDFCGFCVAIRFFHPRHNGQ